MKRTAIVYGVLLLVAMGGAYASWTHEVEQEAPEGVVLVDAKPDEIASISYEGEEIDAKLEVKNDELGRYLWVSTTREVTPKKRFNPHEPDGKPEEASGDKEIQKSTFKAGKAGEQLLEDLAPFRVTRALDVADGELDEFGLDDPKGKLVVTTKSGKAHTFDIGDTAYGHKNMYLRDADTGEVFVIKRSVISPLDRADSRLPEKELFEFPVADIERAIVRSANASLELVQQNRDDAAKATWTTANGEESNASADSWLDKVFRLRASEYVDEKSAGAAEVVFAVKLVPEDGEPVTVEVLRGQGGDGKDAWFARSEYTRGLVKLNGNVASDAADDLATLFPTE